MSKVSHVKAFIQDIGFYLGIDIRSIVAPQNRWKAIGLPHHIPEATILCSYPRSGNTWTRKLLTYLATKGQVEPDINNIDLYVPDLIDKNIDSFLAAGKYSKFFKLHTPRYFYMPRVIYNLRDPRDAEASAYLYWKHISGQKISLDDYLFRRSTHPFGFWHEHVSAAHEFSKIHPKQILFVKYEDLHANPVQELQKIAQFSGLDIRNDSLYQKAINSCLLDKQKSISQLSEDPRKRYTVRNGETNTYRDVFSDLALDRYIDFCGDVPRKVGYYLSNVT